LLRSFFRALMPILRTTDKVATGSYFVNLRYLRRVRHAEEAPCIGGFR
jgi:hypothetical protein